MFLYLALHQTSQPNAHTQKPDPNYRQNFRFTFDKNLNANREEAIGRVRRGWLRRGNGAAPGSRTVGWCVPYPNIYKTTYISKTVINRQLDVTTGIRFESFAYRKILENIIEEWAGAGAGGSAMGKKLAFGQVIRL